ncbi:MAG: hypothetical protein NT033_00030 [Candidatus Omnitrophica bacterium]|nr:hypothetical protein [Candidatus Omnitrophota bacterium]
MMVDVLDDFKYRRSLLEKLNCEEAQSRLAAFLSWLEGVTDTSKILLKLREQTDAKSILECTSIIRPPKASTPEEIAAVGLELMERCKEGEDPTRMSSNYGIYLSCRSSSYNDYTIQANFDEVMRRYIWR